jgi:hypothetical protein
VRENLDLAGGRARWEQIFNRWQFDVVLARADVPLVSLLKRTPGWRVLDQVKDEVLLVRSKS